MLEVLGYLILLGLNGEIREGAVCSALHQRRREPPPSQALCWLRVEAQGWIS